MALPPGGWALRALRPRLGGAAPVGRGGSAAQSAPDPGVVSAMRIFRDISRP